MPLTQKDASILTQVAFKAAVETSGDVLETGNDTLFQSRFDYYLESLKTKVEAEMSSVAPPAAVPAPQGGYDAAAALQQQMGAAPLSIEIVETTEGGQQGPLPEWFIQAAAEQGVTKVFDNRHRLASNPKTPWFKSADDRKIPFWPPKGGK